MDRNVSERWAAIGFFFPRRLDISLMTSLPIFRMTSPAISTAAAISMRLMITGRCSRKLPADAAADPTVSFRSAATWTPIGIGVGVAFLEAAIIIKASVIG